MLTSRVTWQKVLPWSRKPVCRLLTLILLFLASALRLCAQESGTEEGSTREKTVSVLQKGPEYRKGLPFFLPNAIPAFSGVYRYRGSQINVYYTETEILRREAWEPFSCEGSRGLSAPDPETGGVFLIFPAEEQGWTVFFSFREMREDICLFIDTFFEQFRYFRGITRDRTIPPFPAVLQLE